MKKYNRIFSLLTFFSIFLFADKAFAVCADSDTMVNKAKDAFLNAKTNCLTIGDNAAYTEVHTYGGSASVTRSCNLSVDATTKTYNVGGGATSIDLTYKTLITQEGSTNNDGTTPKREVLLRFKKVSDGIYNFYFEVLAGYTEGYGIFNCKGVLNDNDAANVKIDCASTTAGTGVEANSYVRSGGSNTCD